MAGKRPHLHVVGWRGITHSFCIVNQYQLYYLLNEDVNLSHSDAPFPNPAWNRESSNSGFPSYMQQAVDSITDLLTGVVPDYVYTIYYPLELFRRKARHTFVFSVNEYQELSTKTLDGNFYNAQHRDDVSIVTPSQWSKVGYLKAGFKDEQVLVVPHGYDSTIFKPSSVPKSELKRQLNFKEDDFIIATAGTMTFNKGVDVLLRAFHHLSLTDRNVYLILKDASCLGYASATSILKDFIQSSGLSFSDTQLTRVRVISDNLSQAQMATLFQMIDVYVSPYRAEGFGLTPLEAAGCGTPIIVTEGGSTSEYSTDVGAVTITAQLRCQDGRTYLEPDFYDLVHKLIKIRAGQGSRLSEHHKNQFFESWDWRNIVKNNLTMIFTL
jgi:glycosyltransferase involved in cell wall biosynthesis